MGTLIPSIGSLVTAQGWSPPEYELNKLGSLGGRASFVNGVELSAARWWSPRGWGSGVGAEQSSCCSP